MKVVCIEDQEDVLALERSILIDAGHEVVAPVVYSWLCDIDFWFGVKVALVDLTLPGATSGRDILTWLAANVPSVRRICVTAEQEVSASEVQADEIIRKPFTIEAFVAAVEDE